MLLADNGHGTKVKVWNNNGKNGEFQTIFMERSYKDGEEWKTRKISLNADDLLLVARGLEQGMAPSSKSRSAIRDKPAPD